MTSKTTPRDLILGLFFFGVLIGLVIITTQLRNWPGKGDKNYLPVLFEDIYGVKKEDRVLVYGTTWGRVAKVSAILPEAWRAANIDVRQQLGVQLEADETFEPHVLAILELDQVLDIREGYTIYAEDTSLLGGKAITILPGDPGATILPHDDGTLDIDASDAEDLKSVRFYGRRHPHPITAIGEFVDGNQEDFREIVKRVKTAVVSATDPKGSPLGYLLADKGGRDKLDSIVTEFEKFGRSVNNPGSLVYDVTHDSNLRQDVNKIVSDVGRATSSLEDPDTLLGGLVVKNSPLKNRVDAVLGDIQNASAKLNRNDSLVGRVFAEGPDGLGAKAQSFLDDMSKLVADGKANQDSLLYNVFYGEMGKNLRDGLAKFESIASKIETDVIDPVKNSKGLLGWLINDPDAKKQAERLVRATLGIIEDAREAAPVTSLGSFIFGGF